MELIEQVAALKHDLAKYVAWRSANLEESAWEAGAEPAAARELAEALRSDILLTRTRTAGSPETAWEVWERFAIELPKPLCTELEAVKDAVDVLRTAEPALRQGRLPDAPLTLRGAQREIRKQLRDLHRRLLAASNHP